MKETLKLSLGLGIICAIASGVLAYANFKTHDAIKAAEAAEREQALRLVLPAFANKPVTDRAVFDGEGRALTVDEDDNYFVSNANGEPVKIKTPKVMFSFYRARDEAGAIIAVAGEGTTSQGFGGDLQVLFGIAPDGRIGTVVVTSHKETPGLGTQVTDRKEQRSLWDLFRRGEAKSGAAATAVVPPNTYLDQYAAGFKAASGPFKVKQDGGLIDAISGATVTSRAVADAVSRVCGTFQAQSSRICSGN